MTQNSLTIRMEEEGLGLPFDAFADVVFQTIHALRGIDRGMSSEHSLSAKWVISYASMNSPLTLTLTALPAKHGVGIRDAVSCFLEDTGRLEQGLAARHLTPGQQNWAKKIGGALNKGIKSLTFSSNGTTIEVTQRIAAAVAQLGSATTYEIGSVEGRLEVISVHGGRDMVKVWDNRWNVVVECFVSDAQLADSKSALRHRVVVRGQIQYKGGRPRAITDVYDIYAIPDDSELPKVEDLEPIDLFGETEPAVYLRGMTDDD